MDEPLPEFERPLPCDLCGGHQFQLVAKRDRDGVALRTVICRSCGLVAHAEIPSDAELTQYYRRQYRVAYQGEYTPSAHRVVREWNRGRMLLGLLRPYVQPRDQVVEIGCGIGCTVGQFQRAGYCASGIEPNDGFRSFGVEKLGIPICAGVLADLPRRPLADVVLLVHVLEHLPSPTESLAHIRALLRAGGLCYLEVPNAGAPHAAPGRMFHYAHIHNFTRDTVGMLAAKSGFMVTQWLSSPQDKNLRALLQCVAASDWQVVPGSYARAVQSVASRGALRYYLRGSYLRQRVATMMGHAGDRVLAAWRVERILRDPRGLKRDGPPVSQLTSMACRRG